MTAYEANSTISTDLYLVGCKGMPEQIPADIFQNLTRVSYAHHRSQLDHGQMYVGSLEATEADVDRLRMKYRNQGFAFKVLPKDKLRPHHYLTGKSILFDETKS